MAGKFLQYSFLYLLVGPVGAQPDLISRFSPVLSGLAALGRLQGRSDYAVP